MFETHIDNEPHPQPGFSDRLPKGLPMAVPLLVKGLCLAWPFKLIFGLYSLPVTPRSADQLPACLASCCPSPGTNYPSFSSSHRCLLLSLKP